MSKDKLSNPLFILIDLPVFPKGVLPLSLFAVESALRPYFDVAMYDLNISDLSDPALQQDLLSAVAIGLKVSSQNFSIAIEISQAIKKLNPIANVVWGGELPTLLPSEALMHCHAIVMGPIEPVAASLSNDLLSGKLRSTYEGRKEFNISEVATVNFSKADMAQYYSFMGLPFETSKGCDQKCRFCMVHVMQRHKMFKSKSKMEEELLNYKGQFVNILDYNIGVDKQHLLSIAAAFEKSEVAGWMGEMCLESLDDDEVLAAMAKSRCRIIYCGLETISGKGLKSVNKANTNHPDHYERIIRKVQSYGINIASGLILGMDKIDADDYLETIAFFKRMNLIYTKFTFLTYNPGTEVYRSMGKFGKYVAASIDEYDGTHLSYLPEGQDPKMINDMAVHLINDFYSEENVSQRAEIWAANPVAHKEFILFSQLYGAAYTDWLQYDILNKGSVAFNKLLRNKFQKPRAISQMENELLQLRSFALA